MFSFAEKVSIVLALPDQLQHISQSLSGIYPELFLVVFFLAVLVLELPGRKNRTEQQPGNLIPSLHLAGAALFTGLLVFQWFSGARGSLFHQMLLLDDKAVLFKILIALAWLATLFHTRKLQYRFQPELYALFASAVLGACLLCMASNLLTLYLSIELISLSSYLLVGLSPYPKASEGGLKYLLFGGVSSAIMLYGISFLYGLTGSLAISGELRSSLELAPPLVLTVTVLLTLGGLLFKLSLIPFHIWTPDTYEAAPTPVISFLSAVPKIAVLLALSRLVTALPASTLPLLGGIALISMTAGNVGALWQQNARRLMAYSTIAQAGYLIVGIVASGETGFHTAVFYLAAYVLLSMSAFLLLDLFAPQTDTRFDYFHGKGSGWVIGGIAVTVVMVGLAGLPPTAGFTGKWLIFSALWESYGSSGERWMFILLAGGILNAAISLAYYLKIPYLLFFKESKALSGPPARLSDSVIAVTIVLLVLFLFFKPGALMEVIGLARY